MDQRRSSRGGRGRLIATAAAAVFLGSASVLIGVTIASQRSIPQPPPIGQDRAPLQIVQPPSIAASADPPGRKGRVAILPRSRPVSVDIPAIEVDSVVRDLGRTADGALETPAPGPYYDDAAWYRHSPTPGSLGPAILMGHVDSAANGPSVFFRLGELKPGDRVSVTREDDSIAVFVVDRIHRYAKDDFPTETVYGNIDHAGLRIITCGGAFDDAAGHYLDNIVVFASLETADRRGSAN